MADPEMMQHMTDEEMATAINALEQTLGAHTRMLTSIGDALVSLHEMHDERLGTLMNLFSGLTTEVGRFADETKRALDEMAAARTGVRKIPRSER